MFISNAFQELGHTELKRCREFLHVLYDVISAFRDAVIRVSVRKSTQRAVPSSPCQLVSEISTVHTLMQSTSCDRSTYCAETPCYVM